MLNLHLETGPAGRYAVCKLASGHLVRLALQVRRKAVGTLLSAKKSITDLQLKSESDFSQRQQVRSREPYFLQAGYTIDHVPAPIAVQVNGQCRLSDVKYSKTSGMELYLPL